VNGKKEHVAESRGKRYPGDENQCQHAVNPPERPEENTADRLAQGSEEKRSQAAGRAPCPPRILLKKDAEPLHEEAAQRDQNQEGKNEAPLGSSRFFIRRDPAGLDKRKAGACKQADPGQIREEAHEQIGGPDKEIPEPIMGQHEIASDEEKDRETIEDKQVPGPGALCSLELPV
jgi:hypothetical protein